MQMIILLLALASSISVRSETVLLDFTKSDVSTTSTKWSLTNDPVMGGLSYSTWKPDYDNQEGVWSGSVKIVPSLSAPGFCNLMSESKRWPDASGNTHLMIRARSTIPYGGFKASFAADTINQQFKCYKADFEMKSTGEWEEIAIPFSSFSNNWSSYTGEPITSCPADPTVCPSESNLKDISQIGFWMEGAEGDFFFELQSVRAGNGTVF